MLSKRTSEVRVSEKDASKPAAEGAPNESDNNEKPDGETKEPEEISQDEHCGASEEFVKTTERKVQGILRPPRVLEVFYELLLYSSLIFF